MNSSPKFDPVRESYNRIAEAYAQKYFHEFDHKPFDRMVLRRFHDETNKNGVVCDLGCGPGEVAAYLRGLGSDVIGIDRSEQMINKARTLSRDISFSCDDMFQLSVPDSRFAGIAAFYAIVHCSHEELRNAFAEWNRVLKPGGLLLLSFHMGTEVIHIDEFSGIPVSLDFCFFEPDAIVDHLKQTSFTLEDVLIRYPYADVEYPSRRCYVFAVK
jgi:SAM-dependent methyltransferase